MSDENTPSKPTQRVIHADCLDALRAMDADSVDAIVTDPPAGIAFMGKDWDRDKGGRTEWVAWMTEIARECLRVIKPGGHALVWAIPRTSHWTGWAWEDAGWQPRDKVVHLYGSGFPKSLDVSKAIDAAAGAERERGLQIGRSGKARSAMSGDFAGAYYASEPATPEAAAWSGWGTALKPAAEDWWLMRKPLDGTIAANVLKHGTGALNIDGCRIGTAGGTRRDGKANSPNDAGWKNMRGHGIAALDAGRWPANLALDEEAADLLDAQTGEVGNGWKRNYGEENYKGRQYDGGVFGGGGYKGGSTYVDSGGASRFFYTAKASRRERGEGNTHPTVKPLSLMRWLCRLVCPPGGTLLDPFCGSGTTLLAAKAEGFSAIGIEREAEYVEIIQRRLEEATPEWLREIELEGQEDGDTSKTEPAPTSLDDLLGFNDE
jgi:DNA modification methylase